MFSIFENPVVCGVAIAIAAVFAFSPFMWALGKWHCLWFSHVSACL